jgi:hypothetical protein
VLPQRPFLPLYILYCQKNKEGNVLSESSRTEAVPAIHNDMLTTTTALESTGLQGPYRDTLIKRWSRHSSVSVVNRLRSNSQQEQERFLFSILSRPTLKSTQSVIQLVAGAFSSGKAGRGMKMTTHLRLLPELRMLGGMPSLHHNIFVSWCLIKHRDNFDFVFTYLS